MISTDHDSSERIGTESSYKNEDKAEEVTRSGSKKLEEYLELLNNDFDDHIRLLEISLKRQLLQINESLTLREMQLKKYKRKLKEQILKNEQKMIKKMIKKNYIDFSECEEVKSIIIGASKCKLEVVLKHLQEAYNDEDEEEIIDLNDTPNRLEDINSIYNKKKAEINKVMEGFKRIIEDCKQRNWSEKAIAKLKERQMREITKISNKFSKL